MDDLVAFLRARLDEDAEDARLAEAVDPSPWYEDVSEGTYTRQREGLDGVGLVRAADNVGLWDRESSSALSMAAVTSVHVARHDPARVLREVEAGRKLVNAYAEVADNDVDMPYEYGYGWANGLGLAVRLLASVYAAHPDYRPEWAPTV
ncbi:MAG: hypothetical protein HOW97_34195 [Catenulispora sp.]|nr:hypothetical protein [Catenulispora sp.]